MLHSSYTRLNKYNRMDADLDYTDSDHSDDEFMEGKEDRECLECSRSPCVLLTRRRKLERVFVTARLLGLPDRGKCGFCMDYISSIYGSNLLPSCIMNLITKMFPDEGN